MFTYRAGPPDVMVGTVFWEDSETGEGNIPIASRQHEFIRATKASEVYSLLEDLEVANQKSSQSPVISIISPTFGEM